MVNALGDDSTTTYDAEGNITALTDELNRTTTFRYDNRNLLSQMIDPLGHSTSRAYDAIGNLISVSDALGNTTQYGYDALYRQTQVIDAVGETTGMTYDGVGNLASLSDASGNLTTFTYDALERLETETITVDGQALTRRYSYDATSNLTSLIDRNGRTQQFNYDALNRQTQEQWLDGQGNTTRQISYTYDAASQLTAASDPASTYAYTYDLAGRLTRVNNAGTPGVPSVVLSYGYDAVNNLTTVTDTINGSQAGTETVSYDALNRVTQMTQSGAGVAAKRVEMAYDAASQMTGLSRYSSLTGTQVIAGTSYGYDLAGRLTDLTHQRGATVIADYGFTYDAANRLTQLTTPDGTSNYSYNDRHELTNSNHSYQSDEAYDYDVTGNRMSYTTGDHNRLLNDGTYSYEYDNEGNRTRRVEVATGKATEYTWDHRNRLTSIVSKNGAGTITQTVLYAYDVYNRRLSSAIDADGAGAGTAAEENFVYDGSHIALVFDGAGNLTHRYFHGPQIDQVLAEDTAGQTRWALGDHQGSIRDVINNTGTVLNHTTYDSFGQVTGESNPALDFRFGYTGRELDEESGLMQYRARYYDPAVGTFVGEDPLGFGAGDSNLYRYVGNNPTNYVDPSGLIPDPIRRALGSDPGVYTGLAPWEARESSYHEVQRQWALGYIRRNANYMCDAASYFDVTPDAIAGVILWEALENPYDRWTRGQNPLGLLTRPGTISDYGIPGKIHTGEGTIASQVEGVVRRRNPNAFNQPISPYAIAPEVQQETRLLQDERLAIDYIGAILDDHASEFDDIANRHRRQAGLEATSIRRQAGILGTLYQGGLSGSIYDNQVGGRADAINTLYSEEPNRVPQFTSTEKMGPWISQYRWWIRGYLNDCGCASSSDIVLPPPPTMTPPSMLR
ncbi:RHS repeat protein [Nodosilinea sp. LEGE 07088]|nr:RHS repeat protein [Nodosilinea sp. LEGE 07088]